jgi:hypothetical protein
VTATATAGGKGTSKGSTSTSSSASSSTPGNQNNNNYNKNGGSSSKSLSTGAIIGIAIGIGLGFLGLGAGAFAWYKQRSSNKKAQAGPDDHPDQSKKPSEYDNVVKPKEMVIYVDRKTELDGEAVSAEKKMANIESKSTGSVPYPAMRQELEGQSTTRGSPEHSIRYPHTDTIHTPTNWTPGSTPRDNGTLRVNGQTTQARAEMDASVSQIHASELDVSPSREQRTELDGHGTVQRYEMEASYGRNQHGWVELPSEQH